MLYRLMQECRNYFTVDGAAVIRQINIVDGQIDVPLLPGQYFIVEGSIFNDGLHQNGEALNDESFFGTVSPCAIPVAFMQLAEEIGEWNQKYGTPSPFQSESFNGYSYSRATGANGQLTWKDAFRAQINVWRKL